MKVLIKDKAGEGLVYTQKPIPKCGDDEVLIKIKSASVCGTDLHIYNWDEWSQKRVKYPLTVGHELSGEIIELGSKVNDLSLGDIVSVETHIVCNECEMCKTGNAHVCEKTKIIGVDIDGAFAEYIAMPAENCRVQTLDINPKYLSVLEPLGNAVHTMLEFDIEGKNVVVVGCGPIGLMAVNVAKAAGAKKVIAVEINEYRQKLAKELGADLIINPIKEDVIAAVYDATNGKGADVVGEFSGNKSAIEAVFKYTNFNAKVAMLGIPPQNIELDLGNDIVFKGTTIYGVVGRKMYETWDKVESLLATGKVDLDKIVTHEFPMSKFEEAFELMKSGNSGKIILIPEE